MKVKLVNPPAFQSVTRGAGFYGKYLREAFKNISEVVIVDQNPDIIHYLYFDLFFLTLPLFRQTKTIVTVFDLTPLVLPDLYPPGLRGKSKWQFQKYMLSTVDHILTISESAKKDIVKIAGVHPDKITVTYLAAGNGCKKDPSVKKDDSIVYIGDIDPNKNLSSLFKAVSLLPSQKLVLVGKSLSESPDIKKELESVGIYDRVTLTGFVSDEEKVRLLNKAKAYVQPSIYEGFGLPIIEAMACGTPVICGKNSSLPEIAGDAATFTDVSDPDDLADKIRKIKPTGKELSQAAKFSWEKTARETLKVYEKVLSQ